MDAASETSQGFLVIYDPHNLGGGRQIDEATIYDVVPTLLNLLGQPVPARLRGKVIPAF
jgi:arylsulfatase A-like enzyme